MVRTLAIYTCFLDLQRLQTSRRPQLSIEATVTIPK
jgi:hypothetical protein